MGPPRSNSALGQRWLWQRVSRKTLGNLWGKSGKHLIGKGWKMSDDSDKYNAPRRQVAEERAGALESSWQAEKLCWGIESLFWLWWEEVKSDRIWWFSNYYFISGSYKMATRYRCGGQGIFQHLRVNIPSHPHPYTKPHGHSSSFLYSQLLFGRKYIFFHLHMLFCFVFCPSPLW